MTHVAVMITRQARPDGSQRRMAVIATGELVESSENPAPRRPEPAAGRGEGGLDTAARRLGAVAEVP
jgi:hypothetical protein